MSVAVPPADRPADQVATALAAIGGWAPRDEVHARVGMWSARTIIRELQLLVRSGRAEATGETSAARRWRWKAVQP